MVLVYFRGYGNWFINDNGSGHSKYENKVEHRKIDPDHPRACRRDFYWPIDIVEGVFKLTDSDEFRYVKTGVFAKDEIEMLSPCSDQGSAFMNLVEIGRLPADIFSCCYFKIERNKHSNFAVRRRPELAEEGKLEYVLDLIKQNNQSIDNLGILPVNNSNPVYLNPKHPMFSTELRIAIETWHAVLENIPSKPKSGSRKTLVRKWLDEKYPEKTDLSDDAKKRISVLLNPDCDKNGGAPPSFN